jgi:hypothetical protein
MSNKLINEQAAPTPERAGLPAVWDLVRADVERREGAWGAVSLWKMYDQLLELCAAARLHIAPTESPAEVKEQLLVDMAERDQLGRARYGTPLQPHNGRKPLVDVYQEVLDAVVYLRQAIYEQPVWLVSNNEESWTYDDQFLTREEAVAAGPRVLELEPGERFFVGRRDTAHEEEHRELEAAGRYCEECEEDWEFRVVDIDAEIAPEEDGPTLTPERLAALTRNAESFARRTSPPAEVMIEFSDLRTLLAEVTRLKAERDTPELRDFVAGVPLEAAHQRARWGSATSPGRRCTPTPRATPTRPSTTPSRRRRRWRTGMRRSSARRTCAPGSRRRGGRAEMRGLIEIDDVTVKRETEKALLCEIDGEEVWIPKGQIDDDSEVYEMGTEGTLIISKWIAEQKGLSGRER